ncbi:hypothetical protein KEJ45_00520 [Candidatus Bathyarchaeota archaeon]|nr:hypothetical protein [Candidatus Bathyarchaeota archaeon]
MKEKPALAVSVLFLAFTLMINHVYAAEESPINQFLNSPLLALTAIIIIDIIAFLYRRLRK